MVRVARVYEEPDADGTVRVLVDRLWPRGMRKDTLALDSWCRAAAPSTELRQWYGHDPERFAEFEQRYRRELDDAEHRIALAELRALASGGSLTLLTATKDVPISAAAVLAMVLVDTA